MNERVPGRRPALSIAIHTSGRFHVLDLARELTRLGHGVRLHSLWPPWRLPERGLTQRQGIWLGPVGAPFLAASRLAGPGRVGDRATDWLRIAIDRASSWLLKPCDVVIGMSGMSLATLTRAKRLGALTVLERSSRHIGDQVELLGLDPSLPVVARELREYALVDVISVPSRHVETSFIDRGTNPERLFRNPLGVDLDEFPWHPGPAGDAPLKVLFVGTLSHRKGIDVLAAAARNLPSVQFTLVGPPGDAVPAPAPNVVVHAAVPQSQLQRFYADADVLVLPSREDGFGMVMSQGLASGCQVVATTATGAQDLAELWPTAPAPVTRVEPGDVAALTAALAALDVAGLRAERPARVRGREALSWRAYAERYEAMLLGRLEARRKTR